MKFSLSSLFSLFSRSHKHSRRRSHSHGGHSHGSHHHHSSSHPKDPMVSSTLTSSSPSAVGSPSTLTSASTYSSGSAPTYGSSSTFSSWFILVGLIVLIVGSPIAIGSVYIVAYSAMEIMVFTLLIAHIWTFRPQLVKTVQPGPAPIVEPIGNPELVIGNLPERPEVSLLSICSDVPGPLHTSNSSRRSHREVDSYLKKTFLLALPLFIFLAIALFQLIPLPLWLIKVLSPGAERLYQRLGMGYGLYPLTLSVYLTTIAILKWAAYVGLFVLVVTYSPRAPALGKGRWIKALLVAIFAVAFAEAVYGLYVGFNRLDSILWFSRKTGIGVVSGTWINPDHFAGYVNMAFFCSVGTMRKLHSATEAQADGRARRNLKVSIFGKDSAVLDNIAGPTYDDFCYSLFAFSGRPCESFS